MSLQQTEQIYRDIKYSLKQSKRKTLSIHVERDGSVSVIAPENLNIDEINAIIEGKRLQVYRHIAEWESLNIAKRARRFVNGESFLYLGNLYRLEIVESQETPLKLHQGYFHLRKKDLPMAGELFIQFYKDKGLPKVQERAELYSRPLGIELRDIRILDLKNRWASASKNGNLNFHWKCMMAPLKVLDYVIVHELCHILEPTHNSAFWNLVDKLIPDYAERKIWLREHGAGMDL